ncbi:MAG TPA: YARHG domain-containing protein, partial [Pyrinomonadaceae bacterium]
MVSIPPARVLKSLISAALMLVFIADGARAQSEAFKKSWEKFDYAAQRLRREQLKGLSLEDLKLMRGIVFGRHGRIFKDWDIGLYLKDQPWYKPDPEFNNSRLNETERGNLDLIREFEAKLHKTIEPGDMRWWQTRRIYPKNLGAHTGAEWRILRAEIEAIHGKRFPDQPWLQTYFEERYWYRPTDSYDPRQLTETERRNMTAID